MQRSRWLTGLFLSFLCSLALGQTPEKIAPDQAPGKIPPVKVPAVKLPVKEIPGATAALEASRPFIARYAYCNAMQLYQNRRLAWEPIYQEAGATTAELDAYSSNLVNYFKEFCANGRPPNYWQEALARVEAFDNRIDAAMAASLGIGLQDATQLRISRLLVQLENFRERCLGGGQAAIAEDQVSVFGSLLPATSAPPGLTLDAKPAALSLGKCSSGKGSTGTASGSRGVTRETLGACIAGALAQTSSCVSPVGEGPQGEPVDTQNFGGRCADIAGGGSTCTSRTRYVYGNGALSDVERTTTTLGDKRSGKHTIETTHRTVVGNQNEVISNYSRTTVDGRSIAVHGTGDEAMDIAAAGDEASAPMTGVPAGYRMVVRELAGGVRSMDVEPIGSFNQRAGPSEYHGVRGERNAADLAAGVAGLAARLFVPGRGRDCASVNPQDSLPLGLSLIVSNAGDGSPIHAGRLDTWDMVGQCVCNSTGRSGPGLAAASGFRCRPDENTRRLDCLLNPRGPADGIRPECVGYLQADNPGRDTRTALTEWCGHVAQCPPGAAFASTSATGGAMCSCGTSLASPAGGGGGTPGSGRCAAVSCAGGGGGPGAAGADLYRECCGGPGDLPVGVSPPSGLPGLPPTPLPEGLPEIMKTPLPEQQLPEKSPPKKESGGLSP